MLSNALGKNSMSDCRIHQRVDIEDADKRVYVTFVPCAEQKADIFTKALLPAPWLRAGECSAREARNYCVWQLIFTC